MQYLTTNNGLRWLIGGFLVWIIGAALAALIPALAGVAAVIVFFGHVLIGIGALLFVIALVLGAIHRP